MSNLYFYKDGAKYHVMSDEDVDLLKEKHKFKWVDILGSLCKNNFPEILSITNETENNHLIDVSFYEKDLIFYIIVFTIEHRKYFSVTCNKEVIYKKKMPFNKFYVKLKCGHNFVYDEKLDDISTARLFCPSCLEKD